MPLFPKKPLTKAESEALELCQKYLYLVEPTPDYKTEGNLTRGKCYPAALALFVYLGGRSTGYRFMRGEDYFGSHYWVETSSGNILDPTAEQFRIMKQPAPYEDGKSVGYRPNTKKHLLILHAMEKNSEIAA